MSIGNVVPFEKRKHLEHEDLMTYPKNALGFQNDTSPGTTSCLFFIWQSRCQKSEHLPWKRKWLSIRRVRVFQLPEDHGLHSNTEWYFLALSIELEKKQCPIDIASKEICLCRGLKVPLHVIKTWHLYLLINFLGWKKITAGRDKFFHFSQLKWVPWCNLAGVKKTCLSSEKIFSCPSRICCLIWWVWHAVCRSF